MFTVTVSKGFDGGPVWSPYRSDNASCFVSTSLQDTPLVSISPKVCRDDGCAIGNNRFVFCTTIMFYTKSSTRDIHTYHESCLGSKNASLGSWVCLSVRSRLLPYHFPLFFAGNTPKIQPLFKTGSLRVCCDVNAGPMQQSHGSGVWF